MLVHYVPHSAYYVIAYFHYVQALGAVFGVFAGFCYGIGKMSGQMYLEWTDKIHFWTTSIGVDLIFFPMYFLALAGMQRHYFDYPDAIVRWNFASSIGFPYRLLRRFFGLTFVMFGMLPPFHTFEELPRISPTGRH